MNKVKNERRGYSDLGHRRKMKNMAKLDKELRRWIK
jgi:hypothetical protein